MKLKEKLKGKLNKKELSLLVRAFDTIGDIAIIEIPIGLVKKEKIIGETLLEMHKNIKVVCKKKGIHKGKYRRQELRIIAGARRKETLYNENGVRIRLNVEKCYFSPRLSNERKRIMEMVGDKEDVLVMFSGVGPYCLVIAKNTCVGSVYGVEMNPIAHKYALKNVKLNKLSNIKLFKGDVKTVVPSLNKKFDRVLMPLPRNAESYLDVALSVVKKNGVVHYYEFLNEKEITEKKKELKKICSKYKKKCKILKAVKCGQFGPGIYRVCFDVKVSY